MERYNALVEIYKKANPSLKKNLQFKNAQDLWNNVKKDPELYDKSILELKTKAAHLDAKKLAFWKKTSSAETNSDKNNSIEKVTRPSDAFVGTNQSNNTDKNQTRTHHRKRLL